VVIADDQVLVRAGLATLLDSQPGMSVVGQAGDGQEAVRLAREARPDVVLMDVRMPLLDGLAATRRIAAGQPGGQAALPVRVVILTTYDLDEYVYEALRAGPADSCSSTRRPRNCCSGCGPRPTAGPCSPPP
jgi:DNA-binding NarL/FixJ family response regulator